MKSFRTILILTIVLLCAGMIFAEIPDQKARDILVKTLRKYGDLFKNEGENRKGVEVNLAISGENKIRMGTSNGVTVAIDMDAQIYIAQPGIIYFDLSGNLGSFKGLVNSENMLTVSLPSTKQFATAMIPGRYSRLIRLLRTKDYNDESIWRDVSLKYVGSKMLKQGKTHILKIEPQRIIDWKEIRIYILDKRWDPVRFEAVNISNGVLNIEINGIKFVNDMPEDRLKLNIDGYQQLTAQQILSAIMVQSMAETMQKIYER